MDIPEHYCYDCMYLQGRIETLEMDQRRLRRQIMGLMFQVSQLKGSLTGDEQLLDANGNEIKDR